jgi:hypothetical protein
MPGRLVDTLSEAETARVFGGLQQLRAVQVQGRRETPLTCMFVRHQGLEPRTR